MKKLDMLGIQVDKVNMAEAIKKVIEFENNEKTSIIVTPNSEIIMQAKKDPELFSIINGADMVIPDGIGIVIASKILKDPLQERVTGIDLMEEILKYANKNQKSIYILGSKIGVADKAAQNISEKYPNLKIAGTHHGYFKGFHLGIKNHPEEKKVLDEINQVKPDFLFTAFGAPKQEKWMNEYKEILDVKVAIGVGGSIDVYAGEVKRAPKIYQKLCLEWFYRLVKEPWRYKRMLEIPKFLIQVIAKK